MDVETYIELGKFLMNPVNKLQTLILEHNMINDNSLRMILEGLECTKHLQELSFNHNIIGDDGAKAISTLL